MSIINEDLDPKDSRYEIPTFSVGDAATVIMHTDSLAGRIIATARNGKEVAWQEDTATLDPNFKPEFVPGGFVGHCTNQSNQSYTYAPNPDGATRVFTLRTWRGIKLWDEKGASPNGQTRLVAGSHKFHDYNF